MTRDELAALLNGREYGDEVTKETRAKASAAGLVIVHGYSDDNMEFQGAIYDEVGCYGGGVAYLNQVGLIENQCGSDDCPYFEQAQESAQKIEALWCMEHNICWTFKTEIPHSTFEIMEDGGVFCRGIVFSLENVNP